MVAQTRKPTRKRTPTGGGTPQPQAPAARPARGAEHELAADIARAGQPALSTAARLRGSGLTMDAQPGEKEKLSITLDRSLVEDIRAHFGRRALSTCINELLYAALAQARLGELVDDMEQEAGPASPEAYQRVLAQWFADG